MNATGNTLNNSITGNGANNILSGGAGNDTLSGGLGNDTYIVENAGDIITEAVNTGTDSVQSAISWTLGNNLENLTLTGTGAINGTGNTLNNTITGNAANNTLNGGAGNDILLGGMGDDMLVGGFGNDILTGGGGRDRISFNSANQGIDTITDFVIVDDTIDISAAGFGGGLTAGVAITAAQLFSGAGVTTATSANQRFLYNTNTGALLFDADGNGAGSSALQIATLTGHPSITNADIFVTA
ncbi:MAG: calcium-binding protein [Aphanothece sp. CMT-3BRIN-NPC111]|nr:calcium-binding protein [Aphanothece sp. CMT-3BRIN-NPC111]